MERWNQEQLSSSGYGSLMVSGGDSRSSAASDQGVSGGLGGLRQSILSGSRSGDDTEALKKTMVPAPPQIDSTKY